MSIIELQKRVGTVPDGFWGPKSIAACQRHLLALFPKVNPWPSYADRIKFYGHPGNVEMLRIGLPAALFLYGDTSNPVTSVGVHLKCAESLARVFADIHERGLWGLIRSYDGCFNNKNINGTKTKSNHAWAAAVDLNHATNREFSPWPTHSNMAIELMECFAREAWVSAGAFWGRDAMHFEAVKPTN